MLGHLGLIGVLLLGSPAAAAFVWPNTIEQTEQSLQSEEVSRRRQAARRLTRLPDAVARRLALQVLDDSDVEVRLAAADAAIELGIDEAGQRVVSWLSDSERRIRLAAAEVLQVSPTARAIGALGRALGDPDAEIRRAAARALGASDEQEAAMPLLGHLDDSVPRVRTSVVDALARLGDNRAVVPLIGKIQDNRAPVRRAVARALGKLGDSRAASALILALRDNDETVRIAALEALGRLQTASATFAILALLNEAPQPQLRAAALEALARIPSKEGLEALVAALAEPRASRQQSRVRQALVEVGEDAIPLLQKCLQGQPSLDQADGCALALSDIAGPNSGASIAQALRRGVVRSRAALEALGNLEDPSYLPTVLEYLSSADPFVRRAAVDAAAQLLSPHRPDGRAVQPIARALDDANASDAERAALAALLGRTGSPRAVEVLTPLARHADDLTLRAAAIHALGMLGPAGQDEVLLDALDAEQATVRLSAGLALRESAKGRTASTLLDRLERVAEQDRAAVAIALAGALSRTDDPKIVARVSKQLRRSSAAERDAMIEALGRIPTAEAREALLTFARTAAVPDRAKVAEALAAHPQARAAARRMSRDPASSVRANAVWTLGGIGNGDDRRRLEAALQERDVAVAGNAAAALARVAQRTGKPVASRLCAALDDSRPYVQANLLAGLRLVQQRCSEGRGRDLLLESRSAIVRRAAARLVAAVSGPSPEADRVALRHCAAEDRSGSVAAVCSEAPEPIAEQTEPVLVFVVPTGETSPLPQVPFALVRADGLMRLGIADRRGAVFESTAVRGPIRLEVPAPLAR